MTSFKNPLSNLCGHQENSCSGDTPSEDVSSLEDLSDVSLNNPQNLQVLAYRASDNKWININNAGAGGNANTLGNQPPSYYLNRVNHVGFQDANSVTQDSTHRFVTDTEKGLWNGKQNNLGYTPENAANKDQNNGYPGLDGTGKLSPAKIAQDATNRFVTDTEKSTWNAKQAALGYTPENVANKNAGNGYPGLIAGKLSATVIPDSVIRKFYVVLNQAARLALSGVNPGDLVQQTDNSVTYILVQVPSNQSGNWMIIGFGIIAWDSITGKPVTFAPTIGTTATTAVAGNDPRLSNARTPTPHQHAIADITGLQNFLNTVATKEGSENLTNKTIYNPKFVISGMSAGDMLILNAEGVLVRIPGGNPGESLKWGASGPAWMSDAGNFIVIDAGADQSITVNHASLLATASDDTVGNSITGYQWTKITGPVEPEGIGFNGGSFVPLRTRTMAPSGAGDLVLNNADCLPGDLIYLNGNFRSVTLNNVVGTPENPIVFRNAIGTVCTIGNPTWAANGGPVYAVGASDSRHFIFAGTHWDNLIFQGSQINVDGGGEPFRSAYRNISLDNKTEAFEFCYFRLNDGGTSFTWKTDPVSGDNQTWYPNRELLPGKIHDWIGQGSYNEMMYIGHTATYWDMTGNAPYNPSPYDPPPSDINRYKQPIKNGGLDMYNFKILGCGKDAVQIAATKNIKVYQFEITNWANVNIPARVSHNGGIQIGGRSELSDVHDGILHDAWGEHYQFYGLGPGHKLTNVLCYNTSASNVSGDMVSIAGRSGTNNTENTPAQLTITGCTFSRSGIPGSLVRVNGYFNRTGGVSGTDNMQVLINKCILMAPNNNDGINNFDSFYVYTENPQDYDYNTIVTKGSGGNANVQYLTEAIADVDKTNYYLPNNGGVTQGFRKLFSDGPQAVSGSQIVTPNLAATEVTGLSEGVYTFRCTATNNLGQQKSDDVQITVNL